MKRRNKILRKGKKVIGKVFQGGKKIFDVVKGSMEDQWKKWDEEIDREQKKKGKGEPDLFEQYENEIWGKKKRKRRKK